VVLSTSIFISPSYLRYPQERSSSLSIWEYQYLSLIRGLPEDAGVIVGPASSLLLLLKRREEESLRGEERRGTRPGVQWHLGRSRTLKAKPPAKNADTSSLIRNIYPITLPFS